MCRKKPCNAHSFKTICTYPEHNGCEENETCTVGLASDLIRIPYNGSLATNCSVHTESKRSACCKQHLCPSTYPPQLCLKFISGHFLYQV